MATIEQVGHDYHRRQEQISMAAVRSAVQQWDRLAPDSLTESWLSGIGRLVLALVAGAQLAAAEEANPYLEELAAAQGVALGDSALVVADALAGIASDGRSLESLLYMPIVFTKRWIGEGRSVPEALRHGRQFMALLASTQVADAGRAATTVGITGNRRFTTYVRMLSLPSCSRCIILSGRQYSWSEGFARHPRCDCWHAAIVHDGTGPLPGASPRRIFDGMTEQQQDKAFGKAGAEAIRLGSDLGQVVNARRGMQVAGERLVTTEGTSRRGFAGRRMGATTGRRFAIRPMPEQILQDAAGDRDEAVRLLRRFGYLT
ncbi:hypothetical protein ACFQVD_26515 [Streptosporangium amethystogenes subsp. fukuiense]|uniref:Capsid maturation protease n=1 Tax=Streptosporangium amethystogenes subsp. fukuiense TaxID=698418 RepID=A0ABW2T5C6_9ACTN